MKAKIKYKASTGSIAAESVATVATLNSINENSTQLGTCSSSEKENENINDGNNIDDDILHNVIHDEMRWTLVQTRKNKQDAIGDLDSQEIIYTNQISNIWCRVRLSFSYCSKNLQETDVFTGERVLMYGYCLSNAMILAKNKRLSSCHF